MTELLPQAYLIGLIVLLAGASVVVTRQILRVRRDELTLANFGGEGKNRARPQDSSESYELASVQLRKRFYGQASDNLKKALRQAEAEKAPAEARALIENALGFAQAAQNNYASAIRHYRSAIRAKGDYPVALNNLAFALDKQGKSDEARSTYQQALDLDPGNQTATKGLKTLDRRSGLPGKVA